MNLRYSIYLLITTSVITGCTPAGYDVNFDTKMAPEDVYFLDIQRKNKIHNAQFKPTRTHNINSTPILKKSKKNVEDMTYYDGGSTGTTYGTYSKSGRKHHYKIIAQDMAVNQFLYYIFQEILVTDFYVDPKIKDIKEKITLKLNKNLTREELITLLKDLLRRYNVKLEEKDNVFRAVYTKQFPREATGGNLITTQSIRSDISDDTVVSQYIELDYMNATDFINLASGIFFKDVTIRKLKDQNGFIINGTYGEIKKVLNFKKIVDRPFMSKKHTSLVYFDYIVPSDFVKEFTKILKYQNIDDIKLLPLDTINALMVITSNKNSLRFLMKWKQKFDTYHKSNDDKETYFYSSRYRSIKEIYKLLMQFNASSQPAKKPDVQFKPKTEEELKKKEFVKTNKKEPLQNQTTQTTLAPTTLQDGVKIIPDESRNMLIIRATPLEYKKILDVLNKIDTQPLQLLIEANIIEVTLQNDLQYGMEWFLRNRSNDDPATGSHVNILGQTTLGLGNTGFFGIVSSGYFKTMLNLFAKKNLINVLSHPKILVLNGEEASIQVGEKIPTLTSTMSNITNPENAVSTVTYSDTGLTLNVKPSVTANGVIMLDISQVISKGQKNALSNISSPIILNRQISTKLVLRDNQSVIMGGLIQQDVSVTDTKVPILGDMPVIHNLFKSKSNNKTKTELILLIKVHIIDNFDLLDQIKSKFNRMLSIDNSCGATRCTEAKNTIYSYPEVVEEYQPQETKNHISISCEQSMPIYKKKRLKRKKTKKKKVISKTIQKQSIEDLPLAETFPVEEPPVSIIKSSTSKSIEDLPLAKTYPIDQ